MTCAVTHRPGSRISFGNLCSIVGQFKLCVGKNQFGYALLTGGGICSDSQIAAACSRTA